MRIALSVITEILAPIQSLTQWLNGKPAVCPVDRFTSPSLATHAHPENTVVTIQTSSATSRLPCPRLRVVRVVESDHQPGQVGRMTISGRMSDVCAELERLVACSGGAA
jgi:hypothetical protein